MVGLLGAIELAAAAVTPPEEMKVEKWFVGTWTCTGVRHAGPMGPDGKTHSTLSFQLVLGDTWLHFHATPLADPLKGKMGAVGFATWDGTQHQRYDFSPGAMFHFTTKGWDGDKMVFDGDGAAMGQKVAIKHTITRKGAHAYDSLFESEGKPLIEESCTRAKGARAAAATEAAKK